VTTTERAAAALLAVGALMLAARLWVVDLVAVRGPGMAPTLIEGDLVLVLRPPFARVEAGSPVLFEVPGEGVRSVKRAVAGPGGSVEVRRGVASVGGQALARGPTRTAPVPLAGCAALPVALAEEGVGDRRWWRIGGGLVDQEPLAVPAAHWYLLGDHRGAGGDSRQWGPVPEEAITGVAVAVLWSTDPCGAGPAWGRVLRAIH
jgi:signal peptidase I